MNPGHLDLFRAVLRHGRMKGMMRQDDVAQVGQHVHRNFDFGLEQRAAKRVFMSGRVEVDRVA